MKLFDETDDIEDISKIETNQEFAKRFEHNKKREELQRLEELKKKGYIDDSDEDSEESDESDDDVEALASGKNVVELFDVLSKVKNKDPILNQKDVKLFESSSDEGEEEEEKKEKKKKAMYLKDVVAKQLIEDGPELEEDEEKERKSRVKSYYEEQDEYRKAVLDATEGVFEEDDDGDFLKEKKRDGEDEGDETDEEKKKISEFFGPDENLDEKDMFLKRFWTNKLWIDEDKGKKPYNGDLEVLSEDEDEVEKQEMYEASYNYRFEEGAGDQVLGHARVTEGSVRKKDNTRKQQRERKEQRIAEAERQRKEELKHMKNLKKKEIQEKLEKIRAIAGIAEGGACALNADDLEEEFDPEEYDRRMKETFDVDYYDAEEVDPGFGSDAEDLEKPDFDKEDELLGLPKDWDVCGSADGFSAARENNLKRKAEKKEDDVSADSAGKEDELPEESKRKRKRKISLKEKMALDKELEEYYKLDYEGTIGDLKTRFKYTSVPPQRYGLTPEEMLTTDEKELNQYVSLKKLAPYRDDEWKVPPSKRRAQKLKNKSLEVNSKDHKSDSKRLAQKLKNKSHHVEENSKDHKSDNMHKQKDDDLSTVETASTHHQGESQLDELNGEVGAMSRKSRRRRRQADLKLSHDRLRAYGKIPAPSKKKKKH